MIDEEFINNMLGVLSDIKETAIYAKNTGFRDNMVYALEYIISKIEMLEYALSRRLNQETES